MSVANGFSVPLFLNHSNKLYWKRSLLWNPRACRATVFVDINITHIPKKIFWGISFLHWQLELSVYGYKEPDSWSMITMKNQSMQVFWWLYQRYSNPVLYHKHLTQCTSFPRTFTICKSSSWNEKTDMYTWVLPWIIMLRLGFNCKSWKMHHYTYIIPPSPCLVSFLYLCG